MRHENENPFGSVAKMRGCSFGAHGIISPSGPAKSRMRWATLRGSLARLRVPHSVSCGAYFLSRTAARARKKAPHHQVCRITKSAACFKTKWRQHPILFIKLARIQKTACLHAARVLGITAFPLFPWFLELLPEGPEESKTQNSWKICFTNSFPDFYSKFLQAIGKIDSFHNFHDFWNYGLRGLSESPTHNFMEIIFCFTNSFHDFCYQIHASYWQNR